MPLHWMLTTQRVCIHIQAYCLAKHMMMQQLDQLPYLQLHLAISVGDPVQYTSQCHRSDLQPRYISISTQLMAGGVGGGLNPWLHSGDAVNMCVATASCCVSKVVAGACAAQAPLAPSNSKT